MSTIIISAIVFLLMGLAIKNIVSKKHGCGGGCEHCGGACHVNNEK